MATKPQRRTTVSTYKRPTTAQMGYGSRWTKASKRHREQYPLCAECERQGRVTAGQLVDHIRPHKGDMGLFWDATNWQTLCWSCHSAKTRAEEAAGCEPLQGVVKI